ncbi:MAG: NAD-dependent epimerase/dehydratase family protein [Planctomycetes bacterium]|nr:NAD-dependent epimerase/dehydratase family protein [Planctomycetota bacterium]
MDPVVLVTGGSGFIGAWVLRELLRSGARTVSLDVHPAPDRWRRLLGPRAVDVVPVNASLTDANALRPVIDRFGVTHIIHVVDSPGEVATPEELVRRIDRIVPGASRRIRVAGPPIPANVPAKRRPIQEVFPDWSSVSLDAGIRSTIAFYARSEADPTGDSNAGASP